MDALLHALDNWPLGRAVKDALVRILPQTQIWRQYSSVLVAGATLSYVLLCRSVRHRRINSLRRRLGYTTAQSLQGMTNTHAQTIIKTMAQLEFPFVFKQSLSFALFKTYGVPTISSLLVATRMFSTPENASRRYEDTGILIGEFLIHDPREQRTADAIARMNYLHSPYIKAGKISNEDLLYTLSVFITEPVSWINRFEWRQLTDMEVCALGTFWKSIGDAMSIDYSILRRDSWQTGIEFYEDIKEWAQNYEAKTMRPCATNKATADELVPLLLHHVPRPIMAFAREAVGVLLGERLAWVMSYPEPSLPATSITFTSLALRRFVLKNLALPRIFPVVEFTPKDAKTGKYYHKTYLVHPYYVKPTFLSRWGPTACMTRMLGGIVPGGKDGDKYYPDGYTMAEVGPDKKRGEGQSELAQLSQTVKEVRPLGCPFSVK